MELNPLTVSELKNIKFLMLTTDEKIAIKTKGRPTPDFELTELNYNATKSIKTSFNIGWYQRKSWLCGCEVRKALFCFPCLLYGGEYRWTQGFSNLKKLKEYADKHEISKEHLENELSLSLLGVTNIKGKQSEAYRISIQERNKKVTKNRLILSKIIDFVLFCGTCEVPLYGCDEASDFGIFRGLVNFASRLDPELKYHLKTNMTFEGISKSFQNEIFDSLFQVYQSEVKKEIEKAPFVAVMVDDVTDCSEYTQLVIIFRYVRKGEVFERFWGCFIPYNETVEGISLTILQQLNLVLQNDKLKLIAQSLDGACFMKCKKGKIEKKIKELYPNAHLTHCYAHELNLIMKNIASVTNSSKIFFSNIAAISTFFSKSPQLLSILKKHIKSTEIFWNSYVRTICGVYEYLEELKKILHLNLTTSNSDSILSKSAGILSSLNDTEFLFWLEIFYLIVPHIEILYNHMHSSTIEAHKVLECVENFEVCTSAIKNSKYCENNSSLLTAHAKNFFESLSVDMKERYCSTTHLLIAELLNKKKFVMYKKLFPAVEIKLITETYSGINRMKLENELKVFYNKSDVHEYSKLSDLANFITENNLGYIFGELAQLINIILTIPVITKEPGRCLYSMKKIRTFLRSAKCEDRLNALTMIFTEQNFFDEHTHLKDKAIDLFSWNKHRRKDFSLKSGDSISEGGTLLKIFKTDPDLPDPEQDKNRNKKRRTYMARYRALKPDIQPTPATQNPIPNMLLVASASGTNPQLYVVPDIPAELSTESSSSCHNNFGLSQNDIGIKIKEEPMDSVSMERDSDDVLPTNGGSQFQSILIQEHPITIKQEPMFSEEP